MMNRFLFLILFILLSTSNVAAHEVRPGYIEINEAARDVFDISWKQPIRSGGENKVAGLGLRPVFPPHCAREQSKEGSSRFYRQGGALVEQFQLRCEGGLLGFPLGVEGLQKTITDVFVRLTLQDGASHTMRLTATHPINKFDGGGAGAVSAYFILGVEHLLFGFDHILFIIGLVFLVAGLRTLFWTITAFTFAHSLSLALSAFGAVSISPPVVEAVIALSLIFVAWELARGEASSSLARKYPQGVAALFGLVHGLGFAGVIAEIGLPRDAALAALALFNIGLEVGQLLLVAVIVGGLALFRASTATRENIQAAACLLVGAMGVYWFLGRALIIF